MCGMKVLYLQSLILFKYDILDELVKMEKVRNFLLSENIVDSEGFVDYFSELK